MFRRALVGLLLGLLVGGLAAVGLVAGLKITAFEGSTLLLGYLATAVSGIVTGLIAGAPVWRPDAKIEASLKATFGCLGAVLCLFVLRKWANGWDLDLHALQLGSSRPIGSSPVALPVISGLLGALFELDNTPQQPASVKSPAGAVRVGSQSARGQVSASDEEAWVDEQADPSAKRNRR
jgi:hypothetical protein